MGSAGASPALSVREFPALLPVRRPDGRPFTGAKERLAHDTHELECDSPARARSVTCADFLGGVDKSCPPRTTLASVPWTNAKLDCTALQIVAAGVPSTKSFLRTFSLRADHADELPAVLWQGPSIEANKALERAGAAGKSLRDAVPDVHQIVGTTERAKYESKDAWLEIITFAFGDFGSAAGGDASASGAAGPYDGIEDVIVEARGGPLAGTTFYAVLWVLTRRNNTDKTLEVVRRY